ncbi:Disease resistance protein RGA2 [Euphorbia peplus]|nr:Disease resistance protein RGA2 [Euphorbia peplus]
MFLIGPTRFSLQSKMKYIESRFNALLDRRMKFQKATPLIISPEAFSSFDGIGNVNFKVPHRETRSSISDPKVFGRMEDKMILMDRLFSDSDSQFKVLPIVGMGGLGKTTLAKLIYNDETVLRCFEKRYWVYVSQVFDVRMIGKAIMETSENDKFEGKASRFLVNTEETIDAIVRDELRGKRFFLVLD